MPAPSVSLWTKMNWSVRSSERPWSRTRVKVGFQFLVVITRNSCSTTPPPLALKFWVFRIQLDPKELVALHYARSHLRLSHYHQSLTTSCRFWSQGEWESDQGVDGGSISPSISRSLPIDSFIQISNGLWSSCSCNFLCCTSRCAFQCNSVIDLPKKA